MSGLNIFAPTPDYVRRPWAIAAVIILFFLLICGMKLGHFMGDYFQIPGWVSNDPPWHELRFNLFVPNFCFAVLFVLWTIAYERRGLSTIGIKKNFFPNLRVATWLVLVF